MEVRKKITIKIIVIRIGECMINEVKVLQWNPIEIKSCPDLSHKMTRQVHSKGFQSRGHLS